MENNIKKAFEEIEKGDALLIDVRTPLEFAEGNIKGSINIPVETIASSDIDMDKTLYLYCFSGARSERAAVFLKENGYNAENLGAIGDILDVISK